MQPKPQSQPAAHPTPSVRGPSRLLACVLAVVAATAVACKGDVAGEIQVVKPGPWKEAEMQLEAGVTYDVWEQVHYKWSGEPGAKHCYLWELELAGKRAGSGIPFMGGDGCVHETDFAAEFEMDCRVRDLKLRPAESGRQTVRARLAETPCKGNRQEFQGVPSFSFLTLQVTK